MVMFGSYRNDIIAKQFLFPVQATDNITYVFLTGCDHFFDLANNYFVQTLLFFLCIHKSMFYR